MTKMNLYDIKNKISNVKANPKVAEKFKNSEAILPETTKDISDLKDFVEKFEDQIKMFKTEGKKCFDALKRARSNIFCVACSARATMLFLKPKQAQRQSSKWILLAALPLLLLVSLFGNSISN